MKDTIRFYMKIKLPDGTFTNGTIDYNDHPRQMGLDLLDFNGLRVLDVAANDGFWSFWAEEQGSTDVTAIDVDSFLKYDWSFEGPPTKFLSGLSVKSATSQWTDEGAAFRYLHDIFNSKVRRERLSIYDLSPNEHGLFDVIFNYGLLYHLRHPLLSLDRARQVCSGIMILETHLINFKSNLPLSLFYRRNELSTITNWTGPNEAVIVNWLISAGFPYIFSNRTNENAPYARRVFVACINEEWRDKFIENKKLKCFDDQYHETIYQETKKLLYGAK